MPRPLPACDWSFPPADEADETGLVGVGADLDPATLLTAYRCGLFPMPLRPGGPIAWWSPDPRGVLELDDLIVHRSLRRSRRRYEIRIDTAFDAVVAACADPSRPNGWIDDQMRAAYGELHRLGWAHSVEAWRDGQLCGGLYGVTVGGLFAGESMFHHASDASKVALAELVELLDDGCPRLLDVQWCTDHLASLGATEIPRATYLRRLRTVITTRLPASFEASPDPA